MGISNKKKKDKVIYREVQCWPIVLRVMFLFSFITELLSIVYKIIGYQPDLIIFLDAMGRPINESVMWIALDIYILMNRMTIEVRESDLFIIHTTQFKGVPIKGLKNCAFKNIIRKFLIFEFSGFGMGRNDWDRNYRLNFPVHPNVMLEYEDGTKIGIRSKNPEKLVEAIKSISNLEPIKEYPPPSSTETQSDS